MTDYIVYAVFRDIVLSGGTTLIEPVGVVGSDSKFAAIAMARQAMIGDKRRPIDYVASIFFPEFLEHRFLKDKTGNLKRRLR